MAVLWRIVWWTRVVGLSGNVLRWCPALAVVCRLLLLVGGRMVDRGVPSIHLGLRGRQKSHVELLRVNISKLCVRECQGRYCPIFSASDPGFV